MDPTMVTSIFAFPSTTPADFRGTGAEHATLYWCAAVWLLHGVTARRETSDSGVARSGYAADAAASPGLDHVWALTARLEVMRARQGRGVCAVPGGGVACKPRGSVGGGLCARPRPLDTLCSQVTTLRLVAPPSGDLNPTDPTAVAKCTALMTLDLSGEYSSWEWCVCGAASRCRARTAFVCRVHVPCTLVSAC